MRLVGLMAEEWQTIGMARRARGVGSRGNPWQRLRATLGQSFGLLVQAILTMANTRPIYYLHPSFGYYFEFFDMVPQGLIYQLRPLTNSAISGPVRLRRSP